MWKPTPRGSLAATTRASSQLCTLWSDGTCFRTLRASRFLAGIPARPHHYTAGFVACGGLDESLNHHGRAFVYVNRVGKVQNHDLVLPDVFSNGVQQLSGRCDGKGASQRNQSNPGREVFQIVLSRSAAERSSGPIWAPRSRCPAPAFQTGARWLPRRLSCPAAIAVSKSRNTVSPRVSSITTMCSR